MLITVGKRNNARVGVGAFYAICPGRLGLFVCIDTTLDLSQKPPCGTTAKAKKMTVAELPLPS